MTTTIINRSLLRFRVQRNPTQESISLVERSVSPENLSMHSRRSNSSNLNIKKRVEVVEDVAEVDVMWASRLKRSWNDR